MPGNVRGLTIFPGLDTQDSSFRSFASPRDAEFVIFTHPSRWIYTELTDFIDYAINNKLTPFISMQNHYSLVYREEEREMMPTLKVCACILYT